MEEDQINITVENGVKELVIRKGEALEVKPPTQIHVDGTIDAPLRYLRNRAESMGTLLQTGCFLLVYKEKGLITLIVREKDPDPDFIYGNIAISQKIQAFDLESEKYRTPEETAVFLRRRKHLFASESEYTNVFTALRTFKAKVEQEIAQIKDDQGNYELKRIQAVEHNIPKSFRLKLPIFNGTDPVEVEVEILVNKTLDIALFSTDLMQKIDQMRDEIIDKVVADIQKEVPDLLIMYQ